MPRRRISRPTCKRKWASELSKHSAASSAEREFDLVVFGATGFVGKLTADYLTRAAPVGARIAIAGRSAVKLERARSELGPGAESWSIIVVDAADQDGMEALARRTRVVITTVGPYARYGMPLVSACARQGTHYADLTGEPLFVRDCIDAHHETARRSGAKIVNSCGFDSVPSDLSVYALHKQAANHGAGELGTTTLIASIRGGLSGGTIDSLRAQIEALAADPSLGKVLAEPNALSPAPDRETDFGPQPEHALHRAADIDPALRGWMTTFIMAAHNTRIVRRSNGLLDWSYGERFRYNEVMSTSRRSESVRNLALPRGRESTVRSGGTQARYRTE